MITISGELEKSVDQKNCLEIDHFVLDISGAFKNPEFGSILVHSSDT